MIEKQEEIVEKKLTPKIILRIELATRGTISALEAHDERKPHRCIVKKELMPFIIRRIAWIMEDQWELRFDELAIPLPTARWLENNWPAICLLSAERYEKYIIPESFAGVRLGTFEEYQEIPATVLYPIVKGVIKNGGKRARIIKKQHGDCLVMEETHRLLSAGE